MKYIQGLMILSLLFLTKLASADVTVPIYLAKDNQEIGTVNLKDSPKGLVLTPNLHGLPPGSHGFHVHEKDSCEDHGNAAGGHLDPLHTGHHLGPYSTKGHLGDLPVLTVAKDGTATEPVVAPRLKVKDVIGHSLMIHEGGDNYSDIPKKLGGGGARIACGAVHQ